MERDELDEHLARIMGRFRKPVRPVEMNEVELIRLLEKLDTIFRYHIGDRDEKPLIWRGKGADRKVLFTVTDARLAGRLLYFGHEARNGCDCPGCTIPPAAPRPGEGEPA